MSALQFTKQYKMLITVINSNSSDGFHTLLTDFLWSRSVYRMLYKLWHVLHRRLYILMMIPKKYNTTQNKKYTKQYTCTLLWVPPGGRTPVSWLLLIASLFTLPAVKVR